MIQVKSRRDMTAQPSCALYTDSTVNIRIYSREQTVNAVCVCASLMGIRGVHCGPERGGVVVAH